MKLGYLKDHFVGVAAKVLSEVETVGKSSNQHELNGSKPLRVLFGEPTEKLYLSTRFLWVSDDGDEPVVEYGTLTFYDSRVNIPGRSEYRLYYPASIEAMTKAQPGDVVFIAKLKSGDVLFVVAPAASTVAAQLDWLFGTDALGSKSFSVRNDAEWQRTELGLPALYLLDQLEIAAEPMDVSWLEKLLDKFGEGFPSTAEFSAFARNTLEEMDPRADPDSVLMSWMEREELLFRTLERHLVEARLNRVFPSGRLDVDSFVEESLRVHNRRKSRQEFGEPPYCAI